MQTSFIKTNNHIQLQDQHMAWSKRKCLRDNIVHQASQVWVSPPISTIFGGVESTTVISLHQKELVHQNAKTNLTYIFALIICTEFGRQC